jgi:hypothetical protein
VEQWYVERVVLVGDAAHASSPMMGQGGCMARRYCTRGAHADGARFCASRA